MRTLKNQDRARGSGLGTSEQRVTGRVRRWASEPSGKTHMIKNKKQLNRKNSSFKGTNDPTIRIQNTREVTVQEF